MNPDTKERPAHKDTPQNLVMNPDTKERPAHKDTPQNLVMNPDTRGRLVPTDMPPSLVMNLGINVKPAQIDMLQKAHPVDTSVAQSAGDRGELHAQE